MSAAICCASVMEPQESGCLAAQEQQQLTQARQQERRPSDETATQEDTNSGSLALPIRREASCGSAAAADFSSCATLSVALAGEPCGICLSEFQVSAGPAHVMLFILRAVPLPSGQIASITCAILTLSTLNARLASVCTRCTRTPRATSSTQPASLSGCASEQLAQPAAYP